MSEKGDKNIHKGHRQKVKQQYYKAGLSAMPDHNVLEMLLFFGIPYKDTNEIAHLLIETFGSFSGVFKASIDELKNVKGMTENAACLISMILPIYRRYLEDLVSEKDGYFGTEDIADYIMPKFLDTANERVFVMCFNAEHRLILTKQLCEGDISSAAFNLRLLVSTVLESKARSIVLAHNHPSGFAIPSLEDVNTTMRIFDLMKSLTVTLEDHIIFSRNTYCSMASIPKYETIFKDTFI